MQSKVKGFVFGLAAAILLAFGVAYAIDQRAGVQPTGWQPVSGTYWNQADAGWWTNFVGGDGGGTVDAGISSVVRAPLDGGINEWHNADAGYWATDPVLTDGKGAAKTSATISFAPDAAVPVSAMVDYSTSGTTVTATTGDAGTCVNLVVNQRYRLGLTDPSLNYCVYHEQFYTPTASEPVITACAATGALAPTGTWPDPKSGEEYSVKTATPAIGCDAGVCGSTTARVCAATQSGAGGLNFKTINYVP